MLNTHYVTFMRCVRSLVKFGRAVMGVVLAATVLLALALFSRRAPVVDASSARQSSTAQLSFTPASSSVMVGNSVVVTVTLDSVTNLYGYQFQVQYDPTKANADGSFIDSFFDTSVNTYVPGNWNATCASGVCNFAATHRNPAAALDGSGPLAQITFTGVNPGTVNLTFSDDILADRNGNPIPHTALTSMLNVNGAAIVTGTVTLQGRATPITAGTVTLTDSTNLFTPTTTTFDPSTGVFSATVPVDAGGSTYNVTAAHSLYLSNQLTGLALTSGNTFTVASTRLRAGDANNNGTINIFDLSCIGGGYGTAGTNCGGTGSSDINADGIVNIFDLTLAGGNYELSSPQPW